MKIEQGYTPGEDERRISKAIDEAAIVGFLGGVLWMLVLGALFEALKH